MADYSNAQPVILAAWIDRSVIVHIGSWVTVVSPDDNWYDDEHTWEVPAPQVEHTALEPDTLRSVLSMPPEANLAFVTEEVAYVGRRLGCCNLIPVPPVDNPSVTLEIAVDGPVLIGTTRSDGKMVYVDNSRNDDGADIIHSILDLPEYSFGTVYLVSQKVAEEALKLGRYDVVANII